MCLKWARVLGGFPVLTTAGGVAELLNEALQTTAATEK